MELDLQHGLNSLWWFLTDCPEEVPAPLHPLLGLLNGDVLTRADILRRVERLTYAQRKDLGFAIRASRRSFFGVLQPNELADFIDGLVESKSQPEQPDLKKAS